MGERRLIAKSVIDLQSFTRMSASAQALYLRLTVFSDDYGFVANPEAHKRILHIRQPAINELIRENFIYVFPSGVAVIRHWNRHNKLRGKALTPTDYVEEYESLKLSGDVYYKRDKDDPAPENSSAGDNYGASLRENGSDSGRCVAPGNEYYRTSYGTRRYTTPNQNQSFDVADIMKRALGRIEENAEN